MFDQMIADGVISTHGLKADAVKYRELLFDVNSNYFHNHDGYEYAKQFYADAYKTTVEIVGWEQYILSAVTHADERNRAMTEALGNIDLERYKKMSAGYDTEMERLKLEIQVTEKWIEQQQEMNDGLDAFIALTKKYADVTELTPTIVNEYIKKILVYAPDKSGGKRQQRVKVFFNFVDEVDIPVLSE